MNGYSTQRPGAQPTDSARVTEDVVELAVRIHDREDAAQKGEPDPWSEEFPEPYRSERMTAMRLALGALPAGVPDGINGQALELLIVGGFVTRAKVAHAIQIAQLAAAPSAPQTTEPAAPADPGWPAPFDVVQSWALANGYSGTSDEVACRAYREAHPVQSAVTEVLAELERATLKFPTWPTDPLHAVAVLNEEVGELNKAALQAVYEPHKNPAGAVRSEAVQAAAMALRFIASVDRYAFVGCQQHEQSAAAPSAPTDKPA